MDAGRNPTDHERTASRLGRLRGVLLARRGAPASGVLLLLLGGVLASADTPLWWFGGSLLLAAAVLFSRAFDPELSALGARLREPRRVLGRERQPLSLLTELLCMAVVVWVASVMMSEIASGERPVSHDHTIHYFKAWQLHRDFLPHGKLYGWSHRWFAGYPVNYLYPPGADLWVNAVHALCLGLLDFSSAYALAFFLFHVFTGLAVYRLGRVVGSPAVGMVAAIFCLTDLSDFRMGGWDYTIEYGVWPQTLSLDFGLMALCSLPRIVEGRKLAPLGAFGIWIGLSIISHPIQLIVLALLLLATALAAAFAEHVRAATAVVRLLLAYALSLLVAALWLIPFLSCRSETNAMGVWWDSTYEMGKGLLALDAFPGTLGYVLAFGVLAIVVMLRSRRFSLLLIALMALCIPAVSNATFVDELHLPMLSAAFVKVQFIRLSTMVKPFWFVLAGYFLVAVLSRARTLTLGSDTQRARSADESYVKSAVLAAVVGLLTLPVLVPSAQAFWARHVKKSMTTESDRPYLRDRVALEKWLKRSLPKDGFYRVGIFMGHNHELMDLGTEINRPIYKRGFTPASDFVYQMQTSDPAVLRAINLRFAISKVLLPEDDFESVANFGIYTVYRFKTWQPLPFQLIEGEGDVKLERFSDEEIVLRAGDGAKGKLRLNVSYFSRWHAYRDGTPVPITMTFLRESPQDTGFITVPLTKGRYRFAFEPTLGDRLAVPLGFLGLILCGLLIAADKRERGFAWLRRPLAALAERLDRLSESRWSGRRVWLLWTGAALVLGVGVALSEWRPALELQELDGVAVKRVLFDFLEGLSQASANLEYHDANQPCLRQGDRLVCRDEQGNLDNERYVGSSPAAIKEYTMVRCIRARPEKDSLLSITYPDVPVGDAIVGYYGIERAGRMMYKRRPVQFRVMVGGKSLYDGKTESDNKMHWFQVSLTDMRREWTQVVFSVRADDVNKRYFCFYAQMVDLKKSAR
jgi:hypothetical protein